MSTMQVSEQMLVLFTVSSVPCGRKKHLIYVPFLEPHGGAGS